MTTATTNTPIDHTTDAGFRAWGSELSGMLATVGLVQTADTGQINWTTVVRPAANTAAGYEIWRFADSLQSTAPVFLKIEYGTGGSTTTPGTWVTVGSASDGAGSISNVHVPRTIVSGNPPTSTVSAYPSYACHTNGALAVAFKVNSASGTKTQVGFVVTRPLDGSGTVSGEGIALVTIGAASSSAARCFGYAGAFDSGSSTYYSLAPYSPTTTAVATQYQVFRAVGMFPQYLTLVGVWAGVSSEIGYGTAAVVALEGVTERTYMPIQDTYGASNAAGTAHAIIWE